MSAPRHQIRIERLVLDGLHLSDAQLRGLPQRVSEAVRRRLEAGLAHRADSENAAPTWEPGLDVGLMAEGIGHEVARQTAARLGAHS